jgi:hypothetical protein
LVIDESDWSSDDKLSKVSIHPELLLLTQKFESEYTTAHKDRKLAWHPKLGRVTLEINFLSGIRL